MAERYLRGAVIGCGYFARNHLNGWAEVEGAQIVAVCDKNRARATTAAQEFGIPGVYTEAGALFSDESIDFVDVVTQAPTHRPLVEQAASHGLHVICQKPFAPTMDDARAMVCACRGAGVHLMVHENFRWQAPMRAAKQALESGRIGTPFFARITFRNDHDIYTEQPYLAEDARFIIYDLGIHLLDLARYFLGDVNDVTCRTQRINPGIKGEDCATFLLGLRSGGTCVVEASYASHLERDLFPQTLVHIEGEKGSISLGEDYQITLVCNGCASRERVPPESYHWSASPGESIQDSVVRIQRHWVECLSAGRGPETSGLDNLRTLELVFGSYDSAETGFPYRTELSLGTRR